MGLPSVSSRIATAGLVLMLALDVFLVAVALKSTEPTGIDTRPAVPAGVTTISSTTATPSVTPSATATATATTAPAAPLQTMLAALDNQRAWRVTAGSCADGGAKLATTTDGGKTWADAKAPLRRIVRVRPTDGQNAFVIGADSTCAAELQSTTDGGGTWGSTGIVGLSWFRDPKNPSALGAPGSAISRPCGDGSVLDLAVLTTGSARVLCSDGRLRSTTDTGSSWIDSGKASNSVAMAVPSANMDQTYVARLGVLGCEGVQILRVDRSVATSCIKTSVPKVPGEVALSLVDGGGWLAIGNATMRSTDALVTWSAS